MCTEFNPRERKRFIAATLAFQSREMLDIAIIRRRGWESDLLQGRPDLIRRERMARE